jgi:peptidoglycan/xylan/chitin deacetylase (PgdA/CDA1 family)
VIDASWLPPRKRAAVCLTVDDVHPADVARESFVHLRELQRRHPQLRITLFITPDWRARDPFPERSLRTRLPFVRDRVFTVATERTPRFRLDRNPEFCDELRNWSGIEIALHGLHHVRTGMRPVLEFNGRSVAECRRILRRAIAHFEKAGLPLTPGMAPPGWEAPEPLLEAMSAVGLQFVASARDLDTPITADALTNGSGMRGVSLIHPQRIAQGLVHLTSNFQATSAVERALQIVDAGGLLAIKCHVPSASPKHRMLDGITAEYREHLDEVLRAVTERCGDALWWTSAGEIAARLQR